MPSAAVRIWAQDRAARLDELENIHGQIAHPGPGRQWFTEQLNRAYVVALSSQFQGYTRDLHSEVAAFVARHAPVALAQLVESSLTLDRKLDRGNATPGHLGSDFGRFQLDFWSAIYEIDARNEGRRLALEQVGIWRNVIAHDSLLSELSPETRAKIGNTRPTFTWCRRWRRKLSALVPCIDTAVQDHVTGLIGVSPW